MAKILVEIEFGGLARNYRALWSIELCNSGPNCQIHCSCAARWMWGMWSIDYRAHIPRAPCSIATSMCLLIITTTQVVYMSRKRMACSMWAWSMGAWLRQLTKRCSLWYLWVVPNNSRHTEAIFLPIPTDQLVYDSFRLLDFSKWRFSCQHWWQ